MKLFQFRLHNKMMRSEQHGFVPDRFVCLLCGLKDWTRELSNSNPVDIFYFDFSKAFDKIVTRCLVHKLENTGIRDSLVN